MLGPSRIVVDGRRVAPRPDGGGEDALLKAVEGAAADQWLSGPGQLRSCVEHLRRAFPQALFDVFVSHNFLLDANDDPDVAAIRRIDPRAFYRAQRLPQGTDIGRALLLYALSMGDGVVISNDTFEQHLVAGLASVAWIQEKVWGFILGRGDLVLPNLAPVHVPQEAHGVWRARHDRLDKPSMSTALRESPDSRSPVVMVLSRAHGGVAKILKVGPKEKLSVVQMQSELIAGELSTWVKVACTSGEGWLKREHLQDIEGFAPLPVAATRETNEDDDAPLEVDQEARHERADKPGFLSALRESPGLKAKQLLGMRAEPGEQVVVLGLETVVEGEKHSWVKIATSSGAGWLKREHIHREPTAKRRRKGEVWHCSLGGVPSDAVALAEVINRLKELLRAYGLELRRIKDDEAWIEGPRAVVASLRQGKLRLRVGDVLRFSDLPSKSGS